MKKQHFVRTSLGMMALLVLMALSAPLRAKADDDDPPSRVARLSYVGGAVSFQPGGTEDWVEATINRPVTTGDKLWADRDSRAELHIGSASLRISSNTGFSFLNLSDNVTQVQLTAGDLRLRVKRLEPDESLEIDTPNLAFSVLRPGVYRISVNEAGDTTVIKVRSGQGEVTGAGGAYSLKPQEVGSFFGSDQLEADIQRYHGRDDDDFDEWCSDRDRREDRAVSARYVSPDVIGYEDLDQYGDWRPAPGYGTVWFPRVTVVGWAPYRYGHWAYIPPWGYTWVDDAPWGFAPFHYGRWVFVRGMWAWVPAPPPVVGVVYVRPVYAPALVAWVGGPHFGLGVTVGGGVHVGWFPLGPREVYVPSYRVSRTYVTNVNISNTTVNTTVINNYYNTTVIQRTTVIEHQRWVNQGVGITATNTQVLTSCQPVHRNVVRMDPREVSRVQVSVVAPAVAPERRAVLGAAPVARVRPPVVMETRPVVAKMAPPAAPVPFIRQQEAIRANGGRPLSISEVRQIQPSSGAAAHPRVRMAGAPPAAEPARRDRDEGGFRQPRIDRGNEHERPAPNTPAAVTMTPPTSQVPVTNPAATNAPPHNGLPTNGLPDNGLPKNNPSTGNNAPPNNRFPVNTPAATGNTPADRPSVGNAPGRDNDRPGRNFPGDRGNARNDRPPAASNPAASLPAPATNTAPNNRLPVSNVPPANSPASNRPPETSTNNAPAVSNNAPPASAPRTYNDRPGSARPNTGENANRPNSDFDQRRRQGVDDQRARQEREGQDRGRNTQTSASEAKPQALETRPQQVPQRQQPTPQPVQMKPQQAQQQAPASQRVEQRHEPPRQAQQEHQSKESGSRQDKHEKDKNDKDKNDKNDRPH